MIPTDASFAAYYDQAINKGAPDPAAARLWEEYLYSTAGQNLWLEGEARPDRVALPRRESPRQREGVGCLAARAGRRHQLPDPGPVEGCQGDRRGRLAD